MDEDITIKIDDVSKSFRQNDRQELKVLEHVNLALKNGEITALLGKSDSGKSTLLRIIAGLIRPSSGEVIYHQQKVSSPVSGISMVFQSSAVMPWLTVLQNVELG